MFELRASENTRLRAAELLGKTVGLFTEKAPEKKDERSLAELEAELRKRIKGLKEVDSVEGRPKD